MPSCAAMKCVFVSSPIVDNVKAMLAHEILTHQDDPTMKLKWSSFDHYGCCGQSCRCCRHLNPEDGPCCSYCSDAENIYILKLHHQAELRNTLPCQHCLRIKQPGRNEICYKTKTYGPWYCKDCWEEWEDYDDGDKSRRRQM